MKSRKFMTAGEAAIFVALIMILVVWMVFPRLAGDWAVVERSGETIGRYALDRPARIPIQGANGFYLTLVIENGQAYVEDSTCPDLICQHHAPVFRGGETIVCLPGQVTITVEGRERYGPDAVSG